LPRRALLLPRARIVLVFALGGLSAPVVEFVPAAEFRVDRALHKNGPSGAAIEHTIRTAPYTIRERAHTTLRNSHKAFELRIREPHQIEERDYALLILWLNCRKAAPVAGRACAANRSDELLPYGCVVEKERGEKCEYSTACTLDDTPHLKAMAGYRRCAGFAEKRQKAIRATPAA
jgi:hypothetical protein